MLIKIALFINISKQLRACKDAAQLLKDEGVITLDGTGTEPGIMIFRVNNTGNWT